MNNSEREDADSLQFEQTLSKLIDQARLGVTASQNELFKELRNYLLIIANENLNSRLKGKLGPSDIVQQSMIRAVEKIGEYRGRTEAEFRGWLRQIVVNETRLAFRGYATDKRDVRREKDFNSDDSAAAPRDPIDHELTPATHVLAAEQAEQINNLIDQLSPAYQTVIRLRNWEGLPFEEIGKRMGMSTSGVAKIWYRALVEVQILYENETG